MNTLALLAAFSLTLLLTEARITSLGLETIATMRAGLADSDFVIDPNDGIIFRDPEFTIRVADLTNFPVLAASDVQTEIIRINLKAGGSVFSHYHPRGTEIINVIRGNCRFSFTEEGPNAGTVTNIVRPGESTIIPQAYIHNATCVGRRSCIFVTNFNTADPGLVVV